MVWKIEYSETALGLLGKLDKPTARRIMDYLDRRVATLHDPRSCGKSLTGPLGGLWRYRVGDYRVICAIEDEHFRVLVVTLGTVVMSIGKWPWRVLLVPTLQRGNAALDALASRNRVGRWCAPHWVPTRSVGTSGFL